MIRIRKSPRVSRFHFLLLSLETVSYTHLDVYQRQGTHPSRTLERLKAEGVLERANILATEPAADSASSSMRDSPLSKFSQLKVSGGISFLSNRDQVRGPKIFAPSLHCDLLIMEAYCANCCFGIMLQRQT